MFPGNVTSYDEELAEFVKRYFDEIAVIVCTPFEKRGNLNNQVVFLEVKKKFSIT
jgi:hypothetical protein